MVKIEKIDICRKCGGLCCKKSGCSYLVSDFENLKLDVVDKALQSGRVSIVASLNFEKTSSDRLLCIPILYLRARNKNRGVIDLFSFRTECLSLTPNGCYYDLEHRPGAGAAFIPENGQLCHMNIDTLKELEKWIPYQNILNTLVRQYTGKDLWQKLKEDVEDILYKIYTQDYVEIMNIEIEDILAGVKNLMLAFPTENERAFIKAKNNKILKKIII